MGRRRKQKEGVHGHEKAPEARWKIGRMKQPLVVISAPHFVQYSVTVKGITWSQTAGV